MHFPKWCLQLCYAYFHWKPCLPPSAHGDSDTSGLSSKVSLEAFSSWSQRKYSSLRIQQRECDIWSGNMSIFNIRGNYFNLAWFCFLKIISTLNFLCLYTSRGICVYVHIEAHVFAYVVWFNCKMWENKDGLNYHSRVLITFKLWCCIESSIQNPTGELFTWCTGQYFGLFYL